MIYKATNIDTDKFLEEIKERIERKEIQRSKEIKAIEKYYEGYKQALYDIKEMFYCSNYEKKENKNE